MKSDIADYRAEIWGPLANQVGLLLLPMDARPVNDDPFPGDSLRLLEYFNVDLKCISYRSFEVHGTQHLFYAFERGSWETKVEDAKVVVQKEGSPSLHIYYCPRIRGFCLEVNVAEATTMPLAS